MGANIFKGRKQFLGRHFKFMTLVKANTELTKVSMF